VAWAVEGGEDGGRSRFFVGNVAEPDKEMKDDKK